MFSKSEGYERFMGRWSRLLAPKFVEFAQVRDGQEVLDVGCGTGALSFAVRDATKTARVTGVDTSDEFVAHATRGSDDPRVRFQLGDSRELRFGSETFDRTLSMLVLNFIPDRVRALGEMVRVTKPGGSVAAAVWDYGDNMQMLRAFWDEAVALDPSIESRDEKHMPLCRSEQLTRLWDGEGLVDVKETALTVTLRFESFDDYWSPFLLGQGPAGVYASALDAEKRALLQQRLRRRLLGDGPDGAIELAARAWAVTGVVTD